MVRKPFAIVAARREDARGSRGEAFGQTVRDANLPDPFCHAGLIAWTEEGRRFLAFSNPAHRRERDGDLSYTASLRRSMTVRFSRDHGTSWSAGRCIHEGPAGYSDLCALPDGTLFCLYEAGEKGYFDTVVVARFPRAFLEAGE